ncbi:MAG TPA: hypothetical protein VKI18_00355 [Albitalea sp.]|nr:hypothetical protein [Albitalea sp.]
MTDKTRIHGGARAAWRTLFALLLCAMIAGPTLAQGLPFDLDQFKSLADARQRLWELREAGKITQTDYLHLARRIEPEVRSNVLQPLMDELGIKHTGNPPVRGGGVFSDIDGTAPTEAAYQQFLARMRKLDPDLEVFDRYSFRSHKYDVVGWRPGANVPRANGYAARVEQGMGQSLNNELAPTAIPGMGTPHAMEANLEDLTKGAKQMFDPVRSGYAGEADMVAAGKDVLRSMKAAGLCEQNVLTCRWLSDLRTRSRSPRELGFSSHAELQLRLRELAAQAYRASETQFSTEFAELMTQLRKAGTGPERDRLIKLADDMAERATRMAARYETLHKQYPEHMPKVTGAKSPSEFWGEQTDRVRRLRQGQQTVTDNVARAHSLNVLLNMLEFARCMQEETTGASAARRAKARECIVRAVQTYALSKGIEWATGKTINMITVSLPNGAMIASVLPAVMTGVVAVEAGLQVIDAGFEYWQAHQAELEQTAREEALAQHQIRNMAEFPRRLAAEEAVVADGLRAIAARKAALLDDLKRLGREQAALVDKIRLSERRARLDELLPGIKTAAQACWSALGEDGAAPPDPAAELRALLAQAQRLTASCRDRQELQRGDAALQAASQRMDTLRRAAPRPGQSLLRADAAAGDKARALDEAQRLYVALEEAAFGARGNRHELERLRDRVEQINDSIEFDKQSLSTRFEALQQAVPPSLVQALQQNSARLAALRQRIDGITTVPSSAWHPQWSAIVHNDAPLRALLEFMDEPGPRIARVLAEAEDCQQRRAGNDASLDRAEDTWAEAGVVLRSQRAVCVARLDAADIEGRFRQRLAQDEAALKARLETERSAHGELAARHDAALKTAQGLVAQREAAARTAGSGAAAAALAADLAAAPELCTQAQSARQKLADTLGNIDGDEKELEATLGDAQQLATSCKDRTMAERAADKLRQAAGLQTRVDQRAAALPLLAVQVDGLATRRSALLKRRDEAAALAQGAAPAAPLAPIDFGALQAALDAMRSHGEAWGTQEAERHKQHLAQLHGEFAQLPPATLAAGTARLRPLIDGIVATAWKEADLQQRAGQLAALRQRADAARPGARTPAEARVLQAAVQAAACLDPALPNLSAGIQQADTLRSIAQLATQKLGGAARDKLATCTDRLARDLSNADKQARVAAKVCSYAGSEAVWNEREYRPMCRCPSGSRWNAGQTACEPDKDSQVAQADCSRFPNTAARWSDEKGAVVCSCKSGWRPSPTSRTCEPDRDAAVAAKQCPGAHARAYWDGSAGAAACGCAEGYKEDPTGGCEVDRAMRLAQTDCSAFANTEPYWDTEQQRPRCGCVRGYKLNAERRVCEPDARAQVAAVDCSRYANAEAYWDGSRQRAGCRCREGHELNAQTRSCEAPQRSALAGWVGRWTCQFRAQAKVHAKTIQKSFPDQLVMLFAEDGRGGLKASDGSGPWDTVPLTDDTHFSLPAPDPQASPLMFELRGDQVVGQTRLSVEGTMAYVLIACHR